MPDRRLDPITRSRIDALERRYQRVALEVMIAIGLTLIACLAGIAGVRNIQNGLADTQAEQNRARYRAVYSACLERNEQRRGNLRFLERLPASPRVLREARRSFHLEPDCKLYTVRLFGTPAPKGAFELPHGTRPRTAH